MRPPTNARQPQPWCPKHLTGYRTTARNHLGSLHQVRLEGGIQPRRTHCYRDDVNAVIWAFEWYVLNGHTRASSVRFPHFSLPLPFNCFQLLLTTSTSRNGESAENCGLCCSVLAGRLRERPTTAAGERWPNAKNTPIYKRPDARRASCTRASMPARAWRSFPCSLDRSRRLRAQHCLFLGRGGCARRRKYRVPAPAIRCGIASNHTDARSAIAHLPALSAPLVQHTRGRLEERARQARGWRPASTMRPPLRLRHRDPLQSRSPVARAQG